MQTVRYAGGLIVVVALILIGHWFPWPRRLRRLEYSAFVIISILAGVLAWVGLSEALVAVMGLCAAAGTAMLAAHVYDRVTNWHQRAALFDEEGRHAAGRPEDS